MNFSKHNIFSRIRGSENYFIVNLLSGNADILDKREASSIEKITSGKFDSIDPVFLKDLAEKGYLVNDDDEASIFRNKYLDFIDNRESDDIQLFYVPNYSCNFSCSYCYQDQYTNPAPQNENDVFDSFLKFITTKFEGKKKYITIFGGEPLLAGNRQRSLIENIVSKASAASIPLCIVTNGYNLADYTEILGKGIIREVQVTLDGTAEIHNSRRHLKGGGETFDKIVEGIDKCLKNKIPVNLRMVADKDNIGNLVDLAAFAGKKGWSSNPLFKTQIGRNYELHHCQKSNNNLFDRISLYEEIYSLVNKHPEILTFHKPAYSVSKFLSENGSLPDPLFDSCPACKTEWAFDYTGNIYSCTATVGKTDESLGTFYPNITLKEDIISEWENRDVTSIEACGSCNLRLTCGGGCGSVAKNKIGTISAPDCRPVKDLLEMGFSLYLENK